MGGMNKSAMTGFLLCFVMVIFGIISNQGKLLDFLHLPSMIITFGGAVCAVMITSDSMEDFINGWKSLARAFRTSGGNVDALMQEILELAKAARQEGLLALEQRTDALDNDFLKKGVRLMVDGTDPELLRDILETEIIQQEEQDKKCIHFWEDLGAFGPAWGMVGTLLGLIAMMKTMGTDASAIGASMSLALITTLYGSVLANWICIPIVRKLQKCSAAESLERELVAEGILSIQAGENPQIIKEKLRAYRAGNAESLEEAQAQ